MTQPDKDASVLVHIQRLANEEHSLMERGDLGPEDSHRLAALQTDSFGGDPSQAHARDADVVKKYIG